MAVTRNSRPRSSRHNAGRRNHNQTSGTVASRTRRQKRPSYVEVSSESDEVSEAHPTDQLSSSDGETNSNVNRLQPELSPMRASRAASRLGTSTSTGQSSSKTVARFSEQLSEAKLKSNGKSRSKTGEKRRLASQSLSSSKRSRVLTPDVSPPSHNPGAFVLDWTDPRIPFECWTDIFFHAARDGSTEWLANSWLIHAATTCKAFAEPALTAIYRCPAIKTTAKAKRLAQLLERPVSETRFNYRTKVEILHVNVQLIPHGILFSLIHSLNRLQELIVYTPLDQPPYRSLDRSLRWHYVEDIFRALDADVPGGKLYPTALKSWEWSGRFIGGYVPAIDSISALHQSPTFSQLTRLSMTNFQVPSLKNLRLETNSAEKELEIYNADGIVIQSVARAISHLGSLKHLVFESSTVMNDRLLPLLPKNLVHLELINCWEIKSDDLSAFLRTHGTSMRTLTLMHNQSLDLGFLTDLAETCPILRELHMNLSYYRHHDCINDADPMYDQALLPSQVPKWPNTLRVINIEHVRDWSAETAEMFLQSIIDSAPNLPDLRYLAVKTMLDIPWQARATMRREWRDTMETVFLRPFSAPNDHKTLRPEAIDESIPKQQQSPSVKRPSSPSRRSTRIASNSQMSEPPHRYSKSSRHKHDKMSYKEPDTDEDEFASDSESQGHEDGDDDNATAATEDSSQRNMYIHGKCTTVNILFDNQKVRELQYSMEDFGSEESDSEEEWDGDYDDEDNVVVF